MIKMILSTILHHANRETKAEGFYKIKDLILTRYGKVVGHDVQFIEGKKCRSCGGFGYHKRRNWETGQVYDTVDCYHCWWGWYKHPAWVLLQSIQLGRYVFHKPVKKEYKINKPFLSTERLHVSSEVITGYIAHTRSKFGKDAVVALYLLYDWKGYWSRWRQHIGRGWRCSRYWWLRPRNWPNNIVHIMRYGRKAIPFRKKVMYQPAPLPTWPSDIDLPF